MAGKFRVNLERSVSEDGHRIEQFVDEKWVPLASCQTLDDGQIKPSIAYSIIPPLDEDKLKFVSTDDDWQYWELK